jgi:AcrR family transcriptional regulator
MTMVTLRERKRAATRDRIIGAAIALFEARGIDAVTIEEIAASADVGKGTIYNYFTTKEDIIVSFLIDIDRPALAALPHFARDSASVADALDQAAWSLLANKADHVAFVRVFLARLVAADGFAEELQDFQDALDRSLTAFFEGLLARPEVHCVRPIDELLLSFKTLSLGIHILWCLEGPPFGAARELSRRHMELFARELAP